MLNQQQGKRTITNASSSRNSLTKSSTTSSTNLVNSSTTSTTAYNSRTTTTTMNFGRPVPATYQKTTMDTNTITTINHIPTVASTKSNFVVPPKVCF